MNTRILSVLALSVTLLACGDSDNNDSATSMTEPMTGTATGTGTGTGTATGTATGSTTAAYGSIVDVATEAGDFTTLLAAAGAAGLDTTLDQDGPFTVFAPTDAAFDKLPPGTVDALLDDIPTLTDILLYHVVPGEVSSAAVVDMSLVTTVQGLDFRVSTDGGVFINDAEVIVTDIPADNGVIHVIDAVMLPE